MKCNNCGGERWTVISRVGAIETWRCLECSREEVVHVNAPLSAGDLPLSKEPVFQLMAEWSATPGAKEVESLRALFPRGKDLTLATMMRAAREKRQIELGRFTDTELRPMAAILETLNLKLSRVPIAVS